VEVTHIICMGGSKGCIYGYVLFKEIFG
jgi:hypothetical protein